MTWIAKCQFCGSEKFILTWGSSDQVHVNCANLKCNGYVGFIAGTGIMHAPTKETH